VSGRHIDDKLLILLVRPAGVEPATFGFVVGKQGKTRIPKNPLLSSKSVHHQGFPLFLVYWWDLVKNGRIETGSVTKMVTISGYVGSSSHS